MTEKRVWLFREGNAGMRNLLGGKGANLAEMTNLGLPVPPGLTITTETCMDYINHGNKMPEGLMDEVKYYLKEVEEQAGKKFGDSQNPLLVSVRSGARLSMPGMMETILNLGLNDDTVEAMIRLTNNPRFCYDSYRRFLTMFGSVAWEMDRQKYFESEVEKLKEREGVKEDTEISADGWKSLIPIYKNVIKEVTGKEFPQDPYVQLEEAIEAVFRSWNIPRAVAYRNMNKIDHNYGTAVNVQTMVFGNMGDDCATGVSFTRNPATGENKFYGEYLTNAQGEDVVAGIRTPNQSLNLNTKCLIYTDSMSISPKNLNSVTKMFRIWNLRLNAVSYGSFKHVTAKEPLLQLLKSPLICMKKALSQKKEQFSLLIRIPLTRFFYLALIQKQWKKLTRFVPA